MGAEDPPAVEPGTKLPAGMLTMEAASRVKRCGVCRGAIPAPRRRYCCDWCAARGKLALQTWRRRRALAT